MNHIPEGLHVARKTVRHQCDRPYPVEWRGCTRPEVCDDVAVSPPPNDLHSLSECTENVMTPADVETAKPIGGGAFGRVVVLKGNPLVAVKLIPLRIPPQRTEIAE